MLIQIWKDSDLVVYEDIINICYYKVDYTVFIKVSLKEKEILIQQKQIRNDKDDGYNQVPTLDDVKRHIDKQVKLQLIEDLVDEKNDKHVVI